ncbi:MAG: glucokinase [Thermoleophilaceae bacterium]|nr:glucokinase [Thermoleophilaceae bacterium]
MAADSHPALIGVDVGGTKVAAALIDRGAVSERVEHPTALGSSEEVVAGIEAAVREVIEATGVEPAAVGVGVPSQIDHETGTVLGSVNIPLAGVALGQELSKRLGVPVYVDNDGNAAALAEAQVVDGGPASHLVMYTLGTGVGGGVIIDGRIYRGATGLGAELGHAVIQYDGPPCQGNCPNHGCLETMVSGTALERDARALARDHPDSALGRAAANGPVSGQDCVRAAEAGDALALELFDRLGMLLGAGLSGAINTFEPQHVVIGGGLSRAAHLFFDRACREARSRALPALAERVKISLAKAGADAGAVGAGLLALHELKSGKQDTSGAATTERLR